MIDAVMAVEFAAKAIVAGHDVSKLFMVTKNSGVTEAQLEILNRGAGTGAALTEEAHHAGLLLLRQVKSISARNAIAFANRVSRVDVERAERLIDARNAAVHLGDVDSAALDELAADFLAVLGHLWEGVGRDAVECWGDLTAIATANHLTSERAPALDAEVRVVLARRHWFGSGTSANRRSRLDFGKAEVRCPACGHGAVLSTRPAGSAPERCIPESAKSLPVQILDCPACGLSLFGDVQLDWAATQRL